MSVLEIILLSIVWISYGVFNSYQHNWFIDYIGDKPSPTLTLLNIIIAPVSLCIRVFRGIFLWKGKYN